VDFKLGHYQFSHRVNDSRHSAGSCGGMLAGGAFVSETDRIGTDETDETDKTDAGRGSVGYVSSRSGHS
jgi:hypothetical protein